MAYQIDRRTFILYETVEMLYKYVNGISFCDIAESMARLYGDAFPAALPSVCNAWNESAGRCVPGWMCRTLQFSGISGVLRRMQSGITCAWPRP